MNQLNFTDIQSIETMIDNSKDKLQIIFKHSTVCPISRIAYEKFQNNYPLTEDQATIYYVGVIEERPVSNSLAEILKVQHESPQMIVVQNGKQVYNESHLMINPEVLTTFI